MNPDSTFWRERRVLVTGCTGLAGAWAVRALLDHGAHVVGLVRDESTRSDLTASLDRIDVVRGRVEDYLSLERTLVEYEVRTVLHLAGQSLDAVARRAALSALETNVKGTWCLLEACRRSGLHPQVVVASSAGVYGPSGNSPVAEDAPLLATQPLETSKACADLLARCYGRTYGLPIAVVRCAELFGGGDLNWSRLVPGVIRAAVRGERPVVRTAAATPRHFLYVKDLAAALLHLAEALARRPGLAGEAFNLAGESPSTGPEVAQSLLRLLDVPSEVDLRPGDDAPAALDCDKAREVLGWSPHYGLEEALAETVLWYRIHFAMQGGADRPHAGQRRRRAA
jgi:CDP-glucose 4,6-dehydratase